jgi:hypothetical protein
MEAAPDSNWRLEGQKSSAVHKAALYKIQVMGTKEMSSFFMISAVV